jgi:hypothetical protein
VVTLPKPKRKPVKPWIFIMVIVIESVIEGLIIIPPIFQTVTPNFIQLVAFSLWKVCEGGLGYFITRG